MGDAMIPHSCGRLTRCRPCQPQAISAATDASPHRRLARAGRSLPSALLALLGNLLTACAFSPDHLFDSGQMAPPVCALQRGVHHNGAGDYFAFYLDSLAETTAAAKESLQQLGMEYDAQTVRTPSRIVIEGMSVNHYIVKVTLEGINPDQTKATIHANYYGVKTLSLRFQHLLAENLKVSASQDLAR